MSLVFQNIDPPPPSPPGECVPSPLSGGKDTQPGGEGGWGSIFWKTIDVGLPSYSDNLSTVKIMVSGHIYTSTLLSKPPYSYSMPICMHAPAAPFPPSVRPLL